MRFVEVPSVSTSLTDFLAHVPPSAEPLTLTPATPAPVLSWSCACTTQLSWVHLVHPGFDFGRGVMRFVQVAGVSTSLTAFFNTCAS